MKRLIFPDEYFKTEVRDGFAVNELMKRTLAAQLEVLNKIIGICEKYGLAYYAYWGTLLGAVRHKGYIPWDDDLDIAMKREDYIRFLHHIFETFKNNSDVILWWFPCLLDTPNVQFIKQMTPQLVQDYCLLMDEYVREGFGILDLSGNRQRAVCVADVYYGDESELLRMFQKNGKCVAIQDYTKLEENERRIWA